MTAKPILFSTPMVRAILDGRKTQTRRRLKNSGTEPQWRPELSSSGEWLLVSDDPLCGGRVGAGVRIKVGDILWVRETWRSNHDGDPSQGIQYRADKPDNWRDQTVWKPSIHMPRRASRITLRVTAVKVERLQDISEDDAKAEGAGCATCDSTGYIIDNPFAFTNRTAHQCPDCAKSAREAGMQWEPLNASQSIASATGEWVRVAPRKHFQHIWNSINGPGSWDRNDWVAAYTFERMKP